EIAEHGDLGQVRLRRLEHLDRLVHGEQVLGRRLNDGQLLGQLNATDTAPVLPGRLPPGLFDEDIAHRPGGGTEEVAATVPSGISVPDQAEVSLVNDGRWLQRLAGRESGG